MWPPWNADGVQKHPAPRLAICSIADYSTAQVSKPNSAYRPNVLRTGTKPAEP